MYSIGLCAMADRRECCLCVGEVWPVLAKPRHWDLRLSPSDDHRCARTGNFHCPNVSHIAGKFMEYLWSV